MNVFQRAKTFSENNPKVILTIFVAIAATGILIYYLVGTQNHRPTSAKGSTQHHVDYPDSKIVDSTNERN